MMPTHCVVVDRTRVNGRQANEVVPAMQDPPAPSIMDPANQIGLFNPNAYVRGGAVEALGKRYGPMCLRKAAREGGGSSSRITDKATIEAIERSVATGSIRSYSHPDFGDEEDAAFDDLIDMSADRTVAGVEEEDETLAGVESEETEPVAGGAATVEEAGKTPPAAPAAADDTLENMGEENKTPAEKDGKNPAESQQQQQKKKKKQPKPAPVGTAWYLQRGKELDSKRTY